MKSSSKWFPYELLSVFMCLMFAGLYTFSAFAQSPSPSPTPASVAPVVTPGDFLNQIISAIQGIGGLSGLGIASVALMLIVASMKVSYLNTLIWSKLGAFQVFAAPVLGLIAGVLGLGSSGAITAASVYVYVTAGVGAIALHQILDAVKLIPGIGAVYVAIITMVETQLGGPAANPPAAS